MLINKDVAVYTNKVILVPYCKHHVDLYHEWMKDPDIQVATSSEPLSLRDEYRMQQSWRTDSDKLTFISCFSEPCNEHQNPLPLTREEEIKTLIGDVNLFVLTNEEENSELSLVGEIELMIARKENQRIGYGRAALLVFLAYVIKHEEEILEEYFSQHREIVPSRNLAYLRVKIRETNARSIHLFESLGFEKTCAAPNFFDEFELRSHGMTSQDVDRMLEGKDVHGYAEVPYHLNDDKVAQDNASWELRDGVSSSSEESLGNH